MLVKLNVIAAASVALLAGAASAQDMVVKIGHVGPVSGAQAHYGKDNENGARMAIDDLNAKGVTIGGKKVKLELVAEDDAGRSEAGHRGRAEAVRRQGRRRGRPPELGHHDPGVGRSTTTCGIPHITPSATNPKLTHAGLQDHLPPAGQRQRTRAPAWRCTRPTT